MPPKKSTSTTTAASSGKTMASRASTANASATDPPATRSSTTKRKASDDVEDSAPKKKGRPTRAETAKSAPSKSSKAVNGVAKKAPSRMASKAINKTPSTTTKASTAKASTSKASTTKTSTAKTSTTKASTTKASTTKASTTKDAAQAKAPVANTSAKRKPADESPADEAPADEAAAPATKRARVSKAAPEINQVPVDRLNVYVFGEGDNGELGLGNTANARGAKRPRLNPLLAPDTVGVVQMACGGMHTVALTHDNKILTWGVNDQGACGRDTTWSGGLRNAANDSDEDSDDDSDDGQLNPLESTPTAIPSDAFPEGTRFVQVTAGDSASFALTSDGRVFGWGTFRDNQGILGFSKDVEVQRTPMLIPELKKIKQLSCGSNHVLALDAMGNVFAWGSGQQNQLGRRLVERTRLSSLIPREFGLPRKQVKYISAGSDHSFAVDQKNNVWAWGLNNFGQCGIFDNAGDDDAIVQTPQKVGTLSEHKMICLKGGRHHSVGVTDQGKLLAWGRVDGAQTGIKLSDLPEEDLINDERGRPRILKKPSIIPGIEAQYVTAESDHSIAITRDGQAYSWGLSTTYQTGLGTDDDVEVATLIDNTAVHGKKLNWAGAGGQYSMMTSIADAQSAPTANGSV